MLLRAMLVATLACSTSSTFAQSTNAETEKSTQPQSAAATRIHVSGDVMLGRVEHKTMPVYPGEAMTKGIQGDVFFKIDVDERGQITSTDTLTGDPSLVAAGLDALRTYRFHPYQLNGAPVPVETELGYHFSVDKSASGINGHVECITSMPPGHN